MLVSPLAKCHGLGLVSRNAADEMNECDLDTQVGEGTCHQAGGDAGTILSVLAKLKGESCPRKAEQQHKTMS